MHDYLVYVTETVDGLSETPYSADKIVERLKKAENSIHGVFSLARNRFTVLQLRASIDGEGASKSDSDSLHAKLKFVEDCVYQGAEDLVTDMLLKEYIDEFERENRAFLYADMKSAALAETGNARGGGRGAGKGWHEEKQSPAGGKGKGKGANSEVLQWISRGAKMRWLQGPPPRFDHGAAEDRRELLKLKNKGVATPRYESFMRKLEGKVVRLYCDNQAVVAMLSHFTSRNPELLRKMRKLRLLLDLHDIELQARYICSEANEWADRVSRCEDIDDWRLNRQLDDAWYLGAVQLYDDDGFANIVYDDGNKEVVDLAEDTFGVIYEVETPIGEKTFFGEKSVFPAGSVGTSDSPVGAGKNKIKKPGFLEQAFCLRWRTELGDSEHSELAVQMQEAALQQTTKGNYEPKMRSSSGPWAYVYTVFAYVTFGRPDTGVAMQREHVSSTEEELSVVLLKVKGRRHQQVKRRLQIPWRGVRGLRWQVHRDLAWRSSTSSRTPPSNVHGSYWKLPREREPFEGASLANEWIKLALDSLGCLPPEGGHFMTHSTRKGVATGARAVGTVLERVCFFGG
ncbi:hypothetical protein CYMTET_28030 [Cymbomonas tetramitiformis]|uniref:Reverse transcriptase RNase H-like domain-containing protein n=1 Tax=Cymbomonas tetramitiformis TaxID=36881 RepID=A0AAE0KWL8_9CHLO|nr:hypothetical protein CYMTET_28030 [Cymbomonas tetramitiformis]